MQLEDGQLPTKREKLAARERASNSSRGNGEECGVDGTNGGSSESKQNSTHDSHVVTAALERRKKIGLYLLHFGRLPLPSFLLFHSAACIDSGPSKFNGRVDARRKRKDTTSRRADGGQVRG